METRKIRLIGLGASVLTLAFTLPLATPRPALAAACTAGDGTAVVNDLLAAITPVLNSAWPSLAVNNDLDPLEDVYDGDVNIGCKYGGDEYCAVYLAECKKFYLDVDVSSISGLAYLQFEDVRVTSLTAADGTQTCPYDQNAAAGTYGCSYAGQGTGKAFLQGDSQLSATISSIKAKVKCDPVWGDSFTDTLYSAKAKCYGDNPKGTAQFNLCAGSCAGGTTPAVLSYAAMSKLDIKLEKLDCDVSPSSPLNEIAEIVIPEIKDEILDAVTPVVEDALNELFADYLPFPGKCGS